MSGINSRRITIIGGGLAGLTLGIGLRQRGIPVMIWESGHYPRHRVCGEFLSGKGLEVLTRLGLTDLLCRSGAIAAHRAVFHLGGRRGPIHEIQPSALCLSRFAMDAALAQEFRHAGGELREGAKWQDSFPEGVVRASGRRLQESGSEPWHWFGLKVHARNVPLAADLEMHGFGHGYIGLSRLSGQEVNVCGLFRRGSRSPGTSLAAPERPPAGPRAGTKGNSWRELLRGPPGSALHARLSGAHFDPQSFCSVAGFALKPKGAAGRTECTIGDALTMIPPVTGNGMSMAIEAAELAVGPLSAYARHELCWGEAQDEVAHACNQAFTGRLAWARWLQRIMFAPTAQTRLGALFLSSTVLWRILFSKTR